MLKKLSINPDETLIQNAKEYAVLHNTSLSKLVESYLITLVNKTEVIEGSVIEISNFVKRLKTGNKIPLNIDIKKEFITGVSKKYE
jgi:hypothetical protein